MYTTEPDHLIVANEVQLVNALVWILVALEMSIVRRLTHPRAKLSGISTTLGRVRDSRLVQYSKAALSIPVTSMS